MSSLLNKKQLQKFSIFFFTILLINCGKDDEVTISDDVFLGVGKWKVRRSRPNSNKSNTCSVSDLIFNNNLSFKIYTSDNNVIIGTYTVIAEDEISLSSASGQTGLINNIEIENNSISFQIDFEGVCQGLLEGEKDTSYEENKTYIADTAFENYLISIGADDIPDQFVLTSNVSSIEALDMPDLGIRSLVGVEDFASLKGLNANQNQISGIIDLSNNTELLGVDLSNQPIEEIYLNNNPNLEVLFAWGTHTLSVLEFSNSPNLETLGIHDNLLTSLDVSNSPNIVEMRIWDSNLSELNLSGLDRLEILIANNIFKSSDNELILPVNSSLRVASINFNFISSLDLSTSPILDRVAINDNLLTQIDFSANPNIRFLDITANNIQSLDLSPIEDLYWFRSLGNPFNCITLNPSQLESIPPNCEQLGIQLEPGDENTEGCFDNWGWIDFDSFPPNYEYSNTWVVDPDVIFSLECN